MCSAVACMGLKCAALHCAAAIAHVAWGRLPLSWSCHGCQTVSTDRLVTLGYRMALEVLQVSQLLALRARAALWLYWITCLCNMQVATGRGGALAVHVVSSDFTLMASRLTQNIAREGGALYVHSSTSTITLEGCTAQGNMASGDPDTDHHGGVVSMLGSVSELSLVSSSFKDNSAEGQV